MAKMNIKKGDMVYVLSGKSRQSRLTPEEVEKTPANELKNAAERHDGRRGKVMRVIPSSGKVVVEGVNIRIKHTRPSGKIRVQSAETGRVQQPAPLPVSKVMLVCPRCEKPTRPQHELRDGKKVRICRNCDQVIE